MGCARSKNQYPAGRNVLEENNGLVVENHMIVEEYAHSTTSLAKEEEDKEAQLTANEMRLKRLYFAFEPNQRHAHMAIGMARELEDNGWGVSLVGQYVRNPQKLEFLISCCDAFIYFGKSEDADDSNSELIFSGHHHRSDLFSMENQYSLAKERGIKVVHLCTGPNNSKEDSAAKVAFHSRGVERSKMWRAIFDSLENRRTEATNDSTHFLSRTSSLAAINKSSSFLSRDTPPLKLTDASFQSVYIVAPSVSFGPDARELCAMLRIRGIYARVVTERDDMNALASNNEACLGIFMTESLFLDEPVAVRAARAFSKRKQRGSNRIVCFQLAGPFATTLKSNASFEALANNASTPKKSLSSNSNGGTFTDRVLSAAKQRGLTSFEFHPVATISSSPLSPSDTQMIMSKLASTLASFPSCYRLLPPIWTPYHFPLWLSKQSPVPRALLARLDAVIQDESLQLIEYAGEAVSGKSTALAHYCIDHNPVLMDLAYMTKSDASPVVVGAFHFFQHREGRSDSLRMAIVSIYAQLCGTLKGFSSPWDVAEIVDNFDQHESDLCAFFYELMGESIRIGPNVDSYARDGKRIVIVLDGCDECDRVDDLVRILAKWPTFAPKWLVLLVSFSSSSKLERLALRRRRRDQVQGEEDVKNKVFAFRESQQDLREKSVDGLLHRYGLKDQEKIPADVTFKSTNKKIESNLTEISSICVKLASNAPTNALFALLQLNEDAILDFLLAKHPVGDPNVDDWFARKCSSLSGVYFDALQSWFKLEFDSENEEKFQLALRTGLMLPRQAIPERIWRDLEFAEHVPHFLSAFPSLRRHVLRFPFKSMFDFAWQTNLFPESNNLKNVVDIEIAESWNETSHGLLANVLMKEKWLNQSQQQQQRRRRQDVGTPPYSTNASHLDENKTDVEVVSTGDDEKATSQRKEGESTPSEAKRDSMDDDDEKGNVSSESVLKVAADVRRSFLGSISQDVDHHSEGDLTSSYSTIGGEAGVGGMKRYRRVARRPTFIEHFSAEAEGEHELMVSNQEMNNLLHQNKINREDDERQRHEFFNQVVDIQACEEEEFAIENCVFHLFWAISKDVRTKYCRPSLLFQSSNKLTKQELEEMNSPWLERYLHWWTNVDLLMRRLEISFEQFSYSTRLVSDAFLGGPLTELLAEILILSKRALRVDVRQLCGQILGRINPSLEGESMEAARLVDTVQRWLNEHELDFSAVALPFRHFSGLVPVGSDLRRTLQHPLAVYALKFVAKSDQTFVAALTASWDGVVRVFDLDSGRMTRAQRVSRHPILALDVVLCGEDDDGVVEMVCGTADGQVIYHSRFQLVLDEDELVEEDQVVVVEMQLSKQRVNCVQFLVENEEDDKSDAKQRGRRRRRVVSGSEDGSCVLWNLEETAGGSNSQSQKRVLLEPKSGSSVICLLATHEILFTGGSDRTISVMEIETGQVIATLTGHGGEIRSLSFDFESNALCSGSADKTIRLWDCQTWKCARIIQQIHFSSVNSLDFHFPLVLSVSDQVRVYNLLEDRVIQTWRCDGHTGILGGFLSVASLGQQQHKLVGAWAVAEDNVARFWINDFQKDEEASDSKHNLAVTGVSLDMEGTLACSSSLDRTCKIWNLETGQCTLQLKGHHDSVYCCSLSRDGRFCATGSLDRTCRVWDLSKTDATPLRSFVHHDVVFSVFLSDVDDESNERLVVTGSYDGARVFSVESGEIRADSIVKQSLFDVPIQAATESSNIWTDLTVKGADSRAIGFTPDAQGDDLKRVGRFVYGPVGNCFAIWKIY